MMKKLIQYIGILTAGMIVFAACKKDTDFVADYELSTEKAFLRVVHAAPSFRAVFNLPDSFNVYVNGTKMTSPFLTFGSVSPQATTNNGYVAVDPGLQQIKLSVHGFNSTQPDSTQLINFTKVFSKGQYYTLLVTDSIKSAKDSAQMFIPDAFIEPVTGNAAIRFVHTVWNDTATKLVDLFSYQRNATLATNTKPGHVGNFFTYGLNPAVADTLYVTRPAAAGTPISGRIVLAKLAFLPTSQRAYTVYYRGDGNLTTGTKARTLTSYLHQ